MTVEAGYVLIVGAGESLLGLDHFYAVGHSGSEAVFRPSKALIGKLDVLLRNRDLFFGCVEIEKSRSHVIVDLAPKVFCFGLTLAQFSFRLRDVPFDPSAGEKRNPYPSLKSEISMRVAKRWPNVAVVSVHGYDGISFAFSSRKRPRGGLLGAER